MIHLRNEGRIQPPPTLQGIAQSVSSELQSWPGTAAFTHWQLGDPTTIDGAEFHVDEHELGHIHLNGELHLALTDPLRKLLVERRLARPFRWVSSWVERPIASSTDAEQALWLFRLGYDRLRSATHDELAARIEARAAELAQPQDSPRF